MLVLGCSSKKEGTYELANGVFSYSKESADNKIKIIGALEKWAIENKLTGISLYNGGGYDIYHERIKKVSDRYIPGFGVGIISDGQITADLKTEENKDWKKYYHSYISKDPGLINYYDYAGDLSSFSHLVNGEFYKQVINKNKNGYEWVGYLSTANRPIPVNIDIVTGQTTTYHIPVRVGKDYKYATLSSNNNFAAFNGREVKLEDYVTAFKLLYTKSYGFVRGATTNRIAIKGITDYFNASSNGFNEVAWNNVGIKTLVKDNKSYLEFEFVNPCTPFDVLTRLSDVITPPVPEDFIKTLGNGNLADGASLWGKFSSDNALSPIDTFLSTGPYVLERWDKDQQIVFKKNSSYQIDDHYKIQGIHYAVMPETATDEEYAFNQFLLGKIDAAHVPQSKYKDYRKDKRVIAVTSSVPNRLNMNTCSKSRWEELFGENGSIVQTPKPEYWPVKPAMNNKNFLSGLSYAVDREAIADALNKIPQADFFADGFTPDLENGISYNLTEEHKKASESLLKDTTYGHSLEKAIVCFNRAIKELIEQGAYRSGDTIEIEIAWSTDEQVQTIHNLIKEQCEETFNSLNGPLKLKINSWVGESQSDVYYKKLMVGQFDLGFGLISRSTYSHYVLLENLFSDNRYDFTLNWGADTSAVDESIVYDGKHWSFNSLFLALNEGVYAVNGKEDEIFDVVKAEVVPQEDGSIIAKVFTKEVKIDANTWSRPSAFVLFATTDVDEYSDYSEIVMPIYDDKGNLSSNIKFDKENSCYSITIDKDTIGDWKVKYPSNQVKLQGFDLYYTTSLLGKVKENNYITIWEGLFE